MGVYMLRETCKKRLLQDLVLLGGSRYVLVSARPLTALAKFGQVKVDLARIPHLDAGNDSLASTWNQDDIHVPKNEMKVCGKESAVLLQNSKIGWE